MVEQLTYIKERTPTYEANKEDKAVILTGKKAEIRRVTHFKFPVMDSDAGAELQCLLFKDNEEMVNCSNVHFLKDVAAAASGNTPSEWIETNIELLEGEELNMGVTFGTAEPANKKCAVKYRKESA